MAYMISSNMDSGSTEYQVEAAISKVYASVSRKNIVIKISHLTINAFNVSVSIYIQCFDAVSRAAGRASGL